MIVALVTMLLGLTAGVKTIEVAVAEPVARVEMLLDGAAAGVLDGPPWSLEVDLSRRSIRVIQPAAQKR